ncbi:MAG: peptide chain release factor N(5)-glutamine methyltransferase [Deltaproteobacteria bacterium]|jgi:release factor glutamine methyltransferase|nr:peptide chain release factor N(5)-glutamine methyltransferase [Deltaproteobacteria bacterium]
MAERSWTVAEILVTTTDYLAKKDPSCPRLEAELLLSRVLKLNRVNLYVNFERVLTPQEITAYRELVRRRGSHEPVAYILGHKEFYGLDLAVTPATLIPRPETEHLVDEALRLLRRGTKDEKKPSQGLDTAPNAEGFANPEAPPESPAPADETPAAPAQPLAADIGTGSGAIALALLSAHQTLRVLATDVSPEALKVAQENAKKHNLADRVFFRQGNLAEPLSGKAFDVVCANLPYIPDADMATLSPDVANFEPKLALRGGPEGLDLIARLISTVKPAIKQGGHLLLEIWPDSVAKLNKLTQAAGLVPLEPLLDFSSKARIFVARNQA